MRNPIFRAVAMTVVALLVWVAVGSAVSAWFGADYHLMSHIARAVGTTVIVIPVVLIAWRYFDERPITSLGLIPGKAARYAFFAAAVSWLAPFLIATVATQLLGVVTIELTAPAGEVIAFVPLLAVLVFLYEALPEELVFREYIYRNLAERVSTSWAVGIQAIFFCLFGVALWVVLTGSITPTHALMFLAVGAVLGIVRVITGSVWGPIGLHVAFQTAAQLLLSDERGHFVIDNPELFQVLLLGIIPFSLVLTTLRRFYPESAIGSTADVPE